MRRHKLSIRAQTRQGQTTPEDAAVARAKFKGDVRAAILEHNISNVINAVQTAVIFEYLPRKTITNRGEKTVWVKYSGKDKERGTAMFLADWHGNKRPPFLVFKSGVSRHKHVQDTNDSRGHGFGIRLWKEIARIQRDHRCQIYGNPLAWWNAQISIKFLEHHFGSRSDMDEKVLLLWDDFSGHWTQEVVQYAASINVILMNVPPRYTYVCQPADVAWNQPYKTRLRSRWVECLRAQIAKHHAQEKLRAKKAHKISEQVVEVARTEIQEVARETIQELQQGLDSTAFEMVAKSSYHRYLTVINVVEHRSLKAIDYSSYLYQPLYQWHYLHFNELTSKPTAMARSTPSTPRSPEELLRRLAQDATLVQDDVTQHADSDSDSVHTNDDITDSESPLLDSYFESGESKAVVTLINFTMTKFHLLWTHVEPELSSQWTSGRDRQSTTTPS